MPDDPRGSLAIVKAEIMASKPAEQMPRKLPTGEQLLTLKLIARLCGAHRGATTLVAVRDAYVAATPNPEAARDIETGEEVRTNDGKITTKDNRRSLVGIYVTRLNAAEWVDFDKASGAVSLRTAGKGQPIQLPPEWFQSF